MIVEIRVENKSITLDLKKVVYIGAIEYSNYGASFPISFMNSDKFNIYCNTTNFDADIKFYREQLVKLWAGEDGCLIEK